MTAPFTAMNHNIDAPASPQSAQVPQNTGSGNIKVAVRLRPLFEDAEGPRENRQKNLENRAWSTEKVGGMVSLAQKGYARNVEGRTIFHFDQVFDEDAHTPLVYKSIARPMVRAVLDGKHATIFAYGQTGSGKTFTMQGEGKKAGIIQLVSSDLFRFMRKGEATKRDFGVKVSYFEIYNEKIRDLLSDDAESASSDSNSLRTNQSDQVKIRTNADGEIVVNVEKKHVSSVDETLALLIQGNAHRTVAATDMNAQSSRSHSVFRLTVESRSVDEQQPVESQGQKIFRVSDFNLVDLAGSESLKATNNTETRQREGATINKSLLALTTVIQSLSRPVKKRPQHINYRDSKLTRILQPHLSGNAEMAILCCASPSKTFVEETRSTLKFATRAKLVRMKPKINEVMDDGAIIRKLQNELSQVRKQLAELKTPDEKSRERIVTGSTFDVSNDTFQFSDNTHVVIDEERMNDSFASASGFQLDAADPDIARKAVRRYQRGRVDSFDPDDFMNSSQDSTTDSSGDYDRPNRNRNRNSQPSVQKSYGEPPDAIESCDSPASTEKDSFNGPEANYSEMPLKIGSQVSNPETICGLHGVADRGRSTLRSIDSGSFAPNGRLGNSLSWDAMELNNKSPVRTRQPLRALESLNARTRPIPDEVTIIDTVFITGNNICLTDRLNDAEARIKFLEGKLETSDDVIEASFIDLQRARHCIHDLVNRNVQMKVKLNKKGREDTKENYEKGEVIVEQYWILKASLYVSVFFFLSGSHEYFLASVFFVWLALETNVTARFISIPVY